MSWMPYRTKLAFRVDLIDQANHAASLLDPDSGGGETFSANRILTIDGVDYVYTETPLMEGYDTLILSKDQVLWEQALNALAVERGREPISLEDCQALCAGCLVGPDFDPPVPEPDPEPEPEP